MSYNIKRGKTLKVEQKTMSVAELAALPSLCAWDGCHESFKGEMPRGWRWLYCYWSPRPHVNFFDIPVEDMDRDAVLCPCHAAKLESKLIPLCRLGSMPMEGSA
jgi:hypothetical protein